MTHVVTEVCLGCKCGQCTTACPVDAFKEGELMLYIDPTICVDCRACKYMCKRNAIFTDKELPVSLRDFIEINKNRSITAPIRTEVKEPAGFPDWQMN